MRDYERDERGRFASTGGARLANMRPTNMRSKALGGRGYGRLTGPERKLMHSASLKGELRRGRESRMIKTRDLRKVNTTSVGLRPRYK